ncbi:oligosaccharide flippase family protein [Erythrobacter sp. 3-20A1M]|uniref:lipopolysaccharide biosynthesis protein n=1 Tax=Erythrobacter sp. 3-20A1M TaxID=2653850 RepID=UPI001BFCAFFE|nr:oligosaccharide flippase family protein [Erythrobacter sp. 3-20A1M]QWC57964.1 oligosaccharide flippase family protein [Erythrobacter sp. 3-20A1M]
MTSETTIQTSARDRLRAVFGNLGWLLASNAVMAVLSLVYLGIATRTLGLADFGRFALITGAAQTVSILVSFETWKIIVNYGVHHEANGKHEATAQLLKAATVVEFVSGITGIAAILLLFALWPRPFGLAPDVAPYALGYAIVQLATLRQTPIGILRLRDRFNLAALADSVQPLVRLIGALAALAFAPSLLGFLCAWAAAEALTFLAYWILVARTEDLRTLLKAPLSVEQVRRRNPGIIGFLFSTNLQASLGLASRQAPVLFVGGYAGPAAAGAFRLALQLANALSKISILLTRAAFPEIVRSIRAASREAFKRGILRIVAACLCAAAVVMIFVALLGRELLELVGGKAFGTGYIYLLWLAGAGAIELAATSFEPILLSVQRAVTATLARGSAVVIQFAAMFTLMPTMGALGASVSVFAGSMIAGMLLGLALYRYAGRHQLAEAAV